MSSRLIVSRRTLLTGAATLAVAPALRSPAIAQNAPLKVGLMLPYTGTYAKLGKFIDDGFRLYVAQKGGKTKHAAATKGARKQTTTASRKHPPGKPVQAAKSSPRG